MNEIAGVGNHIDFKFRGYDPRLGRFKGSDPMAVFGGQAALSPYHAMASDPVNHVDPLGEAAALTLNHIVETSTASVDANFARGAEAMEVNISYNER